MLNSTATAPIICLWLMLVGCSLPRAATMEPSNQRHQDVQMSSRAILQEGRERELAGDTETAEAAYVRVLELDPGNGMAAHRLAVLHDLRGEFTAARAFYERAIENSQERAEVLCDFGYSRYLHEDYGAAEKALRQALELAPSMRRASINLGLVAAQADRLEEAVQHFIRGGCTAAEAHANLASVHAWRSDRMAAMELVQAPSPSAHTNESKADPRPGPSELTRDDDPRTTPVLRSVAFVP